MQHKEQRQAVAAARLRKGSSAGHEPKPDAEPGLGSRAIVTPQPGPAAACLIEDLEGLKALRAVYSGLFADPPISFSEDLEGLKALRAQTLRTLRPSPQRGVTRGIVTRRRD